MTDDVSCVVILGRESTLDALENMAPSDLFEQLFTAAVCLNMSLSMVCSVS